MQTVYSLSYVLVEKAVGAQEEEVFEGRRILQQNSGDMSLPQSRLRNTDHGEAT